MSGWPGANVIAVEWYRSNTSTTDVYGDIGGTATGFPRTVVGAMGSTRRRMDELGRAEVGVEFLSEGWLDGAIGDTVVVAGGPGVGGGQYRVTGVERPRDWNGRVMHAVYRLVLTEIEPV